MKESIKALAKTYRINFGYSFSHEDNNAFNEFVNSALEEPNIEVTVAKCLDTLEETHGKRILPYYRGLSFAAEAVYLGIQNCAS